MKAFLSRNRIWIGLILGVAGFLVAFWGIDFGAAVQALRNAELGWVAVGAATTVVSLACRAFRWRILFHPRPLPSGSAFAIIAVADMANAILPLRLGEVARVQLAGKREERNKARATATLVVEHALDGLVVAWMLLLVLPFIPSPDWLKPLAWAGAIIGIAAIALMAVAWFKREATLRGIDRLLRPLPERWRPQLHAISDRVIDGFSAVRSPRAGLVILLLSVATWLAGAAMMWILLAAFGMPRSFASAIFLVCMSGLALVVPSAPGDVGVYHAVVAQSLVLVVGIDRTLAASYAVLAHLVLMLPPIILGASIILLRPDWGKDLLRWRKQSKSSQHNDEQSNDDNRDASETEE